MSHAVNRAFPLKVAEGADLDGLRLGKQRLIKHQKLTRMKQAVLLGRDHQVDQGLQGPVHQEPAHQEPPAHQGPLSQCDQLVETVKRASVSTASTRESVTVKNQPISYAAVLKKNSTCIPPANRMPRDPVVKLEGILENAGIKVLNKKSKTVEPVSTNLQPPTPPSDSAPAAVLLSHVLAQLSFFQQRAKIENPLKAAKQRRLVLGLREVGKLLGVDGRELLVRVDGEGDVLGSQDREQGPQAPTVQLNPPPAIIIASNICDEPILNAISILRKRAIEIGVQVVDGVLSRNQLGKACGVGMRQVIVGIKSLEGARKEWKKFLGAEGVSK